MGIKEAAVNEDSRSQAYADAGVDITAGYRAVELMKKHIARTMTEGLDEIGDFGGAFPLDLTGITSPVLVSGTDGVGTKLKLAFLLDKHDTVGIDCVAMCVNDVLCCGAKPLFFLDYIACGRNVPERIEKIVSGVAEGCVQAGAALIGGETAEMPGFYPPDEYDLAGFTVGVVDRSKMIDKSRMRPGDIMLALPSSGVHSNGFSLIRKIFNVEHADLQLPLEQLDGKNLGEALLAPTKIYVRPMLKLFEEIRPLGIAHITGGGFYENIPRSLPKGLGVHIAYKDVRVPEIFRIIMEEGRISTRDMYNTFNMGVGMTVVVHPEDAEEAVRILRENGEPGVYALGEIIESQEPVVLS